MHRSIMLLLVLPVAFATRANAQEITVPPQKESFHLFLLIGQSNMAGRGKVAEEDLKIHPRVLALNKDSEWVPAKDPLHFDKPKMVGVGLGKAFAIDYAEAHTGVTVGLIPCAVGGSPISTWEPGAYHTSTRAHPFDDAIPRAQLAMKSGTLKAMLWHQGEGDSNEKKAPKYEARLHALIDRFRKQLKAPDVPFVVGQLGQFPERPWNEYRKMVNSAHSSLPEKVANTAFVKSDGLVHRGDQTHFDAASYREFGHRYFEAYKALVKPAAVK